MSRQRLDQALVKTGLLATRSQAANYIKLGQVKVNGRIINKPGYLVGQADQFELTSSEQYVSRAALKLASVAEKLRLNFQDKVILDVGSSTGGFTDYALKHGAKKVIAVDVGTDQLHPSLHGNPKIELHEKTDIRDFTTSSPIDLVVADVSFISLRKILPHIADLSVKGTLIVAMVKPQFETAGTALKHKGIVKNDTLRRDILKAFETWTRQYFIIEDKADSAIQGTKGNQERFYRLRKD